MRLRAPRGVCRQRLQAPLSPLMCRPTAARKPLEVNTSNLSSLCIMPALNLLYEMKVAVMNTLGRDPCPTALPSSPAAAGTQQCCLRCVFARSRSLHIGLIIVADLVLVIAPVVNATISLITGIANPAHGHTTKCLSSFSEGTASSASSSSGSSDDEARPAFLPLPCVLTMLQSVERVVSVALRGCLSRDSAAPSPRLPLPL